MCVFIKFCTCDEIFFLSFREQSLIYWCSYGVVMLGLSDRALDTADPVSVKCFRVLFVTCTVPLETWSLEMIWCSDSHLALSDYFQVTGHQVSGFFFLLKCNIQWSHKHLFSLQMHFWNISPPQWHSIRCSCPSTSARQSDTASGLKGDWPSLLSEMRVSSQRTVSNRKSCTLALV